MLPIKSLSNSSWDRFLSCPLSYFYRYLDPERPKQEGVQEFYGHYGTLVHWLAEMYPRTNFYPDFPRKVEKDNGDSGDINNRLGLAGGALMAAGSKLTRESMLNIYDELFPLIHFPNEQMRQSYYDAGKAFIDHIVDEMDWSKVIGIEQEFNIDLQIGTPPLIGFIDKVERDEKGIIVTDYKTSKPYSPATIMRKNQLPIYGMASYFLYGELPYKYRYHFVRFNKVVEVEIPVEMLTRVKNALAFSYSKMAHYAKEGKFPAQFSSFYCKNFCGYTRLCPTFQNYSIEE